MTHNLPSPNSLHEAQLMVHHNCYLLYCQISNVDLLNFTGYIANKWVVDYTKFVHVNPSDTYICEIMAVNEIVTVSAEALKLV